MYVSLKLRFPLCLRKLMPMNAETTVQNKAYDKKKYFICSSVFLPDKVFSSCVFRESHQEGAEVGRDSHLVGQNIPEVDVFAQQVVC